MNIDDLIRAANPVQADQLPSGDAPGPRRALARILGAGTTPAVENRVRSRKVKKRILVPAGLVTVAASRCRGRRRAVIRAIPFAPRRDRPGHVAAAQRTSADSSPQPSRLPTARQVLLTAAEHVTPGLASGKYWRVQLVQGITYPGGTKADPYDISVTKSADQWNPASSGEKEWVISQQTGAHPATPADEAAWRAAGSPTAWTGGVPLSDLNVGVLPSYPYYWSHLAATTAASAGSATWQVSDGTVGYVEGDLPGLSAAQFRQLPATQEGMARVLRQYYKQLPCATEKHPTGCSTENQIIWDEAVRLLQDPVSQQVKAATFKVMAALPGVRVLGQMTDPLGRSGYALDPGEQAISLRARPLPPGGGRPGGPVERLAAGHRGAPADAGLLALHRANRAEVPVCRTRLCGPQLPGSSRRVRRRGQRRLDKCGAVAATAIILVRPHWIPRAAAPALVLRGLNRQGLSRRHPGTPSGSGYGRRPAHAVADAVVAAALAFQHGPARDDIAVVVVRKPHSAAAS